MSLDKFEGAQIRRAKHEKDFVVIHRHTAQDRNISFEARGMLLYLLSKPDTWSIQVADLAQQCQKGRVYRILKELIEAGYIENRERKQLANGKFEWTPYILHERPVTNIVPFPEKPDMEKPVLENADILVKTDEEKIEKETTSAPVANSEIPATPLPVQAKLTKPEQDAWYEAVKTVWGFLGGRNIDYQKFVRGESKKGQFAEYALAKPLSKPEQLVAWGKWQKAKAPDLTMISSPAKVQNSIDNWLELQSKPVSKPITLQQRKAPANLDMLKTEDIAS